MKRIGKTYVIVTDDGPNNENGFLSWTTKDGGYYTTVDTISEIKKCDFHATVDSAIERANDANSGTMFGWDAPMKVVELLNFDEAYNEGADPVFKVIMTITF
jgi:hypothetical protein